MIGTEAVNKLNALSVSDNIVQRRIVDMADNIKSQMVEQIKDSPIICLQLDESTDVSSYAQLIVYVRYIHNSYFKDELLCCHALNSTTRGIDVFCTVNSFFEAEGINWSKVKAVCTDGAPSMPGRNSGFQALVKVSPDVIANHCMIHREALAAKTLLDPLNNVLKDVVKVVNYVKSSALNTRLFRNLCESMDADRKNLLFHTEVHWLSCVVLQWVFDVRVELKEVLMVQGKDVWESLLPDEDWLSRLCYPSDIFEHLNVLNLSLQGRDSNILMFCDKLSAFQGCLNLWVSKVVSGHHAMFSIC